MQTLIITLLCIAVLVLVWHVRELWGEIDLLKTMERRTQESHTKLRKEFNSFVSVNQTDRKILLEELREAKRELDEVKETAMDRNIQEARMFEGISNMMNYDISTAREAVKGDG